MKKMKSDGSVSPLTLLEKVVAMSVESESCLLHMQMYCDKVNKYRHVGSHDTSEHIFK